MIPSIRPRLLKRVFLPLMALTGIHAADFHVSPDGVDSNPGTTEQPFATIARARDAVRAELKKNSDRDITVLLHGGTYRLTEPVVFGLEDSASPGHSITYAAAPGEKPLLTGALAIKDWRKLDQSPQGLPPASLPHVRVASLPKGLPQFRVLSDRQGFLQRARSPMLRHVVNKQEKSFDRLFLEPGQIPEGWAPKQAELSLMPMVWIHNYLPIASWNPATGEIVFLSKFTLARNLPQVDKGISNGKYLKEPWKFSLENALEFLDEPGEWVVDPDAGLLYLWPRQGEPDGVEAHHLAELIRVEGTVDHEGSSEKPARGLVFKGLSFTGTDRPRRPDDFEHRSIMNQWDLWDYGNAAVRFRSAEDCVVDACRFDLLGDVAIRADLLARRIQILNNLIANNGGTGILLAGYGLGTKNVNGQNRIHNNALRDIGQITRSSMGIVVSQSEGNEVSNNDLNRVGYTGIAILGRATWEPGYLKPEWGAERLDYWPWEPGTTRGPEVDAVMARQPAGTHFLQVPELLHSRNNIIRHNRLANTCLTGGDGNGIYIAGAGLGNRIEENILRPPSWEIIRCDDDQHGTTVVRNVILDGGKFVTKGKNRYHNNILYVREWGVLCEFNQGRLKWERDWKSEEWSIQHISKNIVFSKSRWIKEAFRSDGSDRKDFENASTNDNIYWSPSETGREEFEQDLKNLQAAGKETCSLLADPLFVDPEKLDFRFKEGSPAIQLGIEGIDARGWGLTADFPYSEALAEFKKTRRPDSW